MSRLSPAVAVLVLTVIGVVTSAVFLIPAEDTQDDMPSGLTGTPITAPTPATAAAPATPTARPAPPVPTVDTSHAVPAGQTTLLEVDTGRLFRWEDNENVQNARFSPDSRWLVYNQGWIPGENDLANSRIYRIDLAAPEIDPQLIAVGFNPTISSRGDIAFNRQFDEQQAHVYVAGLDGSVRRLDGIGATFNAPSWSPNGRWLVYASGYIGEGIEMPVTLLDTTTWEERTVDHIQNCRCDSGYDARWSPDSRYYASAKTPRVFDTATSRFTAIDDLGAWIRENAIPKETPAGLQPRQTRQVVTVPASPQNRIPTTDVLIHEVGQGVETLILTGFRGICLRWSPDYRWLVADDFCDTI